MNGIRKYYDGLAENSGGNESEPPAPPSDVVYSLQDRNFDVRLAARIDKRLQDSGMLDMMLKGSKDYDQYKEVQKKFFESLADITLEQLQGKNPNPLPVYREPLFRWVKCSERLPLIPEGGSPLFYTDLGELIFIEKISEWIPNNTSLNDTQYPTEWLEQLPPTSPSDKTGEGKEVAMIKLEDAVRIIEDYGNANWKLTEPSLMSECLIKSIKNL